MKRIYLLSTEHLEDGLWFRDEEDFKVAMNYIAIEAARHPEVTVLTFILMSNHVHFVLKGRREDVVAFAESFKQRYSLYYQKKYGVKEFLRRNNVDVVTTIKVMITRSLTTASMASADFMHSTT